MCDLDQVLMKEVMAKNCGLTILDLKERSPVRTLQPLPGFSRFFPAGVLPITNGKSSLLPCSPMLAFTLDHRPVNPNFPGGWRLGFPNICEEELPMCTKERTPWDAHQSWASV